MVRMFVPGDPAVQIIGRVRQLVHGEVEAPGWGYQLAGVSCKTTFRSHSSTTRSESEWSQLVVFLTVRSESWRHGGVAVPGWRGLAHVCH